MSSVFVIAKSGVYLHHVPGVWATLDDAVAAARLLALDDGRWHTEEGDGYHDWEIYSYEPGVEPPNEPVATIGFVQKRTYDFTNRVPVPRAGFGYWHGQRKGNPTVWLEETS